MSDLEFRRELSPDQIRQALSLLDSAAGAKNRNLEADSLNPAGAPDPGGEKSGTTDAKQSRFAAAEDPRQYRKHLNLVIGFFGLGIAATAALTLLSWSERALTPPPAVELAREQSPSLPTTPLPKSAAVARPAINMTPDQNSAPSERPPSQPQAKDPSPAPQAGAVHDQAALKNAVSEAGPVPYAARTPTAATAVAIQAWPSERGRQKEASWHARGRVTAARKRFSRHHWLARGESSSECFPSVCRPWQDQRALYPPPRNVIQ